ncbi:MAG: MlaD family protein [Candidatus Omnitrophota bacterium]|nr:MlaD family protein [Candidatus Omnitrophota bacterium]
MRRLDFEFKVGMFVAIGIAIFISMIFSIGSFRTFEQRYNLKAHFYFANGIQVAAPVRLAGVQVGEVREIDIIFDKEKQKTIVELTLLLNKKAKVEKDAEVFINTLGLIGEKYIEIMPGTAGNETLKPGQTLIGKDSVPVEKVTEKAYEMMVDLKKLTESANIVMDKVKTGQGTVGKLFMDDSLYKELEAFIKDLKAHPWKLLQKPRGGK